MNPVVANDWIGEIGGIDGKRRCESQRAKRSERFRGLFRNQLDDQVDVFGETLVTMQIDGDAAHDDVADAGGF